MNGRLAFYSLIDSISDNFGSKLKTDFSISIQFLWIAINPN